MLERKILNDLIRWKHDKNHVCLLVKGARQVGKTYIIDYFAKNYYANYVYINFEQTPSAKEAFQRDLDIDTIILELTIRFPKLKFIEGETIVFLDEIQSCPQARTALKFFSLDKRFDVIASGSLLGLNYQEVSSYPVGYEEELELYSLDFEEFLWALDINRTSISYLKDCFQQLKPISRGVHEKMKEYFLWYTLVGGMPNVVSQFIKDKNFSDIITLQKNIVNGYLQDISKYALQSDKVKARECFLSIPSQLSKVNKKFVYSEVSEKANARKYESSLQWLLDAGIISFCYNIDEPRLPLEMHKQSNKFKIYMNDVGLLLSMMEPGIQKTIFEGNLLVNNGAIYENLIAQMFVKNGKKLYYFEKKGKLEMDFMINLEGEACAIEVKSGDNLQAKSLTVLMSDKYKVKKGIKLTKENIAVEGDIIKLPWYLAMFL